MKVKEQSCCCCHCVKKYLLPGVSKASGLLFPTNPSLTSSLGHREVKSVAACAFSSPITHYPIGPSAPSKVLSQISHPKALTIDCVLSRSPRSRIFFVLPLPHLPCRTDSPSTGGEVGLAKIEAEV